ncbi:MAG TPA: A24 family peptidase [Tepidisphaeraceae bacterium]|nr:A24 family peptidase [Tepidisphaeraceae bacterium]
MTTYGLLMCAPLFALLAWAAVTDWHTRRIPNWLTFTLVLTGFARAAFPGGDVGFRGALVGLLVAFCFTFVFYAFGVLGGGDVKLMAGVGAWLGPVGALQVFAAQAAIGMVMAIAQAHAQGRLRSVLRNTVVIAGTWAGRGTGAALEVASESAAQPGTPAAKRLLPYSLPVLLATAAVLALRWGRP